MIIFEDVLIDGAVEELDAAEDLSKDVVKGPVVVVVIGFVLKVVLVVLVVFVEATVVDDIELDEIGTTNTDVVVVIKVDDGNTELELTLPSCSNSIILFPRSWSIFTN